MRHALLISGYLRSFKENFDFLKKNLLDLNNLDIYIHVTKFQETKYNNKDISIDEVRNLLNPKVLLVTNNFFFSSDEKINNILNQNYKLFLLNEKRKEIEKLENITYTNIIKLRPDVCLQDKIDLNIELDKLNIPLDTKIDINKLYIPTDKYICDVIAYGNVECMNKYLNFYTELSTLILNYGTVNETLLYYYLHNNKINYKLINLNYIIILSLCNTIAITGDSGSGKTMTSNIIKDLFSSSFILECDRYHKWERGNKNWDVLTHLNPNANYLTKMENDIFNLKIGNTIYQVDYDHSTGKFTDKQHIESKENIIICGLHTLYISENITNLKIYMDTDDNLRIPWKIKRDVKKRGYTIEKILKQIDARKKDFNDYIYPQREKADIIINFFTDKIFNIDTFKLEDTEIVYLRIGIKNIFNISKFISNFEVYKIEKENNFIFLYFDEKFDYIKILKNIIIHI